MTQRGQAVCPSTDTKRPLTETPYKPELQPEDSRGAGDSHEDLQLSPYDLQNSKPAESKTRTYHRRVGTERLAERPGEVGQDWVPTELFTQEEKVHRTLQGIEETSLQRFSRSTNKRNLM